MDNRDVPRPTPIETAKPSANLSEQLTGMFPEIDELYEGSNSPAGLLELKLLKYRYSSTPWESISGPTTDPEEQEIFAAAMREDVQQKIAEARTGNPVEAYQAAKFMAVTLDGTFTFDSWFGYRGRLLGKEQCIRIGEDVVAGSNFTRQEASQIMAKNKKEYYRYMKQERKTMEQER